MKTLTLLLMFSSCAPAMVEPPPSPTPTPSSELVAGAACYSYSDCKDSEICVDPRYPVCGAKPSCDFAPGSADCGCECKTPCTATSCAADEVCSANGCCTPRPCTLDAECSGVAGNRCTSGRCVRRGTCSLPPP